MKLDLIKYGTEEPVTLVDMKIINDGTGNSIFGNYKLSIVEEGKKEETWRLKNFQRDNGCLKLLYLALKKKIEAREKIDQQIKEIAEIDILKEIIRELLRDIQELQEDD
jgi:DNA primase large subunit